MFDPIKASILVLDPDADFLESVSTANRSPDSLTVVGRHFSARDREGLTTHIQEQYPDVLVINLDVDSELDFGKVITEIQGIPMPLPPLILGTTTREAFALKQKVYRMGIDDILLRPFMPQELWFRIEVLLKMRRLQRQIDAASRNLSQLNSKLSVSNRKLEQMTLTDDLTGLSNMRYMYKFLENQFMILKRHPRPFAILMMDLDHFKQVNDKNDHLVGSSAIQKVGHVIEHTMRKMDVKARYGGDEYIVAMPETDEKGARLAGERLREAIARTELVGSEDKIFTVTASIGIAGFDVGRHPNYKELIKDADCSLYESKRKGRNRVTWYVDGVTERPDPEKLERT